MTGQDRKPFPLQKNEADCLQALTNGRSAKPHGAGPQTTRNLELRGWIEVRRHAYGASYLLLPEGEKALRVDQAAIKAGRNRPPRSARALLQSAYADLDAALRDIDDSN